MPPFPRINPIASAAPAPDLASSPPSRSRRAPRSSAISGRCWIRKKKKDDAIENKYLFELNNRWTIDGSVRKNVARYINHACKPNAESDVKPAQAQGLHPRHQEHRAGRGDQLRLRHRLFQSLSEADRLQMRGLREEAQEAARRGAGGEGPPEGQGRAQGAEEGGEAGQGKGEAKAKLKEKAERKAKKTLKLNGGSPRQIAQGKSLNGQSLEVAQVPQRQTSERQQPRQGCRQETGRPEAAGCRLCRACRLSAAGLEAQPVASAEVSSAGLAH